MSKMRLGNPFTIHMIVLFRRRSRRKRKVSRCQFDEPGKRFISKRKVKTCPIIQDAYDYSKISDEVFFQMLSDADNGFITLSCLWNTDDEIKFIRQYTSLIDRLSYVQLQELHWKYYHHVGTTQHLWNGHLAKHLAEKYAICHRYGRSKTLIEQRLTQIARQLQHVHNDIQQFEEETFSKYSLDTDCASVMRRLSSILRQFVQEKQRPLQQEFEYNRHMLILDATDHQLLQKFFHAQPNKAHVSRGSLRFLRYGWILIHCR